MFKNLIIISLFCFFAHLGVSQLCNYFSNFVPYATNACGTFDGIGQSGSAKYVCVNSSSIRQYIYLEADCSGTNFSVDYTSNQADFYCGGTDCTYSTLLIENSLDSDCLSSGTSIYAPFVTDMCIVSDGEANLYSCTDNALVAVSYGSGSTNCNGSAYQTVVFDGCIDGTKLTVSNCVSNYTKTIEPNYTPTGNASGCNYVAWEMLSTNDPDKQNDPALVGIFQPDMCIRGTSDDSPVSFRYDCIGSNTVRQYYYANSDECTVNGPYAFRDLTDGQISNNTGDNDDTWEYVRYHVQCDATQCTPSKIRIYDNVTNCDKDTSNEINNFFIVTNACVNYGVSQSAKIDCSYSEGITLSYYNESSCNGKSTNYTINDGCATWDPSSYVELLTCPQSSSNNGMCNYIKGIDDLPPLGLDTCAYFGVNASGKYVCDSDGNVELYSYPTSNCSGTYQIATKYAQDLYDVNCYGIPCSNEISLVTIYDTSDDTCADFTPLSTNKTILPILMNECYNNEGDNSISIDCFDNTLVLNTYYNTECSGDSPEGSFVQGCLDENYIEVSSCQTSTPESTYQKYVPTSPVSGCNYIAIETIESTDPSFSQPDYVIPIIAPNYCIPITLSGQASVSLQFECASETSVRKKVYNNNGCNSTTSYFSIINDGDILVENDGSYTKTEKYHIKCNSNTCTPSIERIYSDLIDCELPSQNRSYIDFPIITSTCVNINNNYIKIDCQSNNLNITFTEYSDSNCNNIENSTYYYGCSEWKLSEFSELLYCASISTPSPSSSSTTPEPSNGYRNIYYNVILVFILTITYYLM